MGEGWIRLFDGPLTAEVLEAAMRWARETAREATPGFVGRDWATVGRAHRDAYERAVQRARGRGAR